MEREEEDEENTNLFKFTEAEVAEMEQEVVLAEKKQEEEKKQQEDNEIKAASQVCENQAVHCNLC